MANGNRTTALSGSRFKPPALPEVSDSLGKGWIGPRRGVGEAERLQAGVLLNRIAGVDLLCGFFA